MTPQQQRERDALCRAVIDAPGDEAPRLILADWLDDHGEAGGDILRQAGGIHIGYHAGIYFHQWWAYAAVPSVDLAPVLCGCGRQACWSCGNTPELYLCDSCDDQYRADPNEYLDIDWQAIAEGAEAAPPAGDEIPF